MHRREEFDRPLDLPVHDPVHADVGQAVGTTFQRRTVPIEVEAGLVLMEPDRLAAVGAVVLTGRFQELDGLDAMVGGPERRESALAVEVDDVECTIDVQVADVLVAPHRPRTGTVHESVVPVDPGAGGTQGVGLQLRDRPVGGRSDIEEQVATLRHDLGEQCDDVEPRHVVLGPLGPVVAEAGPMPRQSSHGPSTMSSGASYS